MGILRTAAWLSAALAVGFPHVTLASDAGPGKEVRALRHDAPIILAGRLDGAAVTVDSVRVDGDRASVRWHTSSAQGTDGFQRYYGAWVDTVRDGLPNDPLVHVTLSPRRTPFTMTARMPTYAESWANAYAGGNSYAFFTMTFDNTSPVAYDEGAKVRVWLPFLLDTSLRYELTVAYAQSPMDPIYAKASGTTVEFTLPPFALPPKAHLVCVVDAMPDR